MAPKDTVSTNCILVLLVIDYINCVCIIPERSSRYYLSDQTLFYCTGIGRTLIPRYFRSIFEGGVTDLRYELRHPKESFHNTTITLDCDQCTVVTLHGKPMFTKVMSISNSIANEQNMAIICTIHFEF